MSDTKAPPVAASLAPAPTSSGNIGFLSILHDANGILGGYLVTNSWGRPLEFRLTTAIQPNRVQQILYGPTLTEHLHAELIGKTLVEKTSTTVGLIVTDSLSALELRAKVDLPVLALVPPGVDVPGDVIAVNHSRSSITLAFLSKFANDRALIEERLDKLDPALDLAEPFTRVREAVLEARKMGVSNRAA